MRKKDGASQQNSNLNCLRKAWQLKKSLKGTNTQITEVTMDEVFRNIFRENRFKIGFLKLEVLEEICWELKFPFS